MFSLLKRAGSLSSHPISLSQLPSLEQGRLECPQDILSSMLGVRTVCQMLLLHPHFSLTWPCRELLVPTVVSHGKTAALYARYETIPPAEPSLLPVVL